MATSTQHGFITATSIQDSCFMVTTLSIEIFYVALGMKVTCNGSEITKTVIDSVDKKVQVCIQSGGNQLKNFVFES